jgi:hypothetical protein
MNTISATLVKLITDRQGNSFASPGVARLIRLDTPFPIGTSYRSKRKVAKERTTRYIFISTSCVMGEVETYAFPAYSNGKVFDFCELPGSMKGTSDHSEVLSAMGIEVK